MAGEASLGRAVLELSTDAKKLDAGLADVPKKVKKTGDSVKALAGPLTQVNGLLQTFGVGLSVGAVVAFGKSILDLADNVTKVHDRTGLAVGDVQRLQYIAEQSGNSIDDLAGSISKLQVRLADGKAQKGIENLGLNFKQIRESSPYDALAAVAEAIGKIENPTLRAQRAVEVFGKAGTEILPTLVSNFKELGAAAPVMSDETVAALDSAGDAIARFGSTLKVWAAESYNYARGFFDKLIAEAYRMVQRLYENAAGLAALAAKLPGADRIGLNQKLVDSLKESAVWYGNVSKSMETNTVAANKNAPAVGALPPIHKAASKEAKAHADAIANLTERLSGAGAIKAAEDMRQALEKLPPIQKLTKDSQIQIAQTMEAAIAVYRAAGKSIPQDMTRIALQARVMSGTIVDALKDLKQAPDMIGPALLGLSPKTIGAMGGGPQMIAPQIIAFSDSVRDLVLSAYKTKPSLIASLFGDPQTLGASLGNAIMGAIQGGGSVVNAAAGMLGQQIGSSISKKIGASLMKEGAGVLSTALGGLLQAVLPGIGALLGPLLGKAWDGIKKLFGGGNDGRALVEQFAAGLGGFDELQKRLLTLGPEYERLWKGLTQLSSNASAAEAQAAIDAVTAALAKQEEQASATADEHEAAAVTTEEGALATIETATQASAALDTLNAKIADNETIWSAWSTSTTAAIEAVGVALRSLQLPTPGGAPTLPVPSIEGMADGGMGRVTGPTLFYSAGDEDFAFSGEGRSFGLSALASRPIVLNHTTEIDGRVAARSSARHTPNELERLGIRSR